VPELPDVEIFRRYFAATALHQSIERVHVGDSKNAKVLEGIDPQRLGLAVTGRSFEKVRRHGKYCFAEMDDGRCVVLHFGMTGYLKYYKASADALAHERVRFDFENGYRLGFLNQRLLGTVAVTGDVAGYIASKRMGPDALADLGKDQFDALLMQSRAKVKSVLTDQEKIAGIGNVYADEILFQARIHPGAQANRLDSGQRRRLFESMGMVLDKAIGARADVTRMPASFLLPVRDRNGRCPRCGGALEKIKVQGRGTYLCPACQNAV